MVSHAGAIDGFYSIVVLLRRAPGGGGADERLAAARARGRVAVGRRRFLGLPEISWNARLLAQEERLREERRAAELAREASDEPHSPSVRSRPLPAATATGVRDMLIARQRVASSPRSRYERPLEHFQDDLPVQVRGWGLRDEFVVRFQYASDGSVASLLRPSGGVRRGIPASRRGGATPDWP